MSHSRSQTRLLTLFQDNKLDVPHQTSFPLDTLLMHYIRESVSSVLIYEAPIQAFQLLGKTQLLSFWKKEKIPSPLVSHRFLHSLSLSLIITLYTQPPCSNILFPPLSCTRWPHWLRCARGTYAVCRKTMPSSRGSRFTSTPKNNASGPG